MSLLRQLLSFGLAGLVTAWILLGAPAPSLDEAAAAEPQPEPFTARLEPISERAVPVESVQAPAESDVPPVESQSPPEPEAPEPEAPEQESNDGAPAPELGSRDGDEASELRDVAGAEPAEISPEEAAPAPEQPPAPARATAAELAADTELKELARRELSGEEVTALGFSTVLVSSPEDQLQIARAFGERVVLIPKAALGNDPDAQSFELSFGGAREPRIVAVKGRPDLTQSRQYRDLFAYDFQRLDPKLRELRRRVIRRDEVFLFAALIPASEWAVVIGRRREACAASGVDPEEVEQYTLRYVRDPRGGFDIVVDKMTLADGSQIRPSSSPAR